MENEYKLSIDEKVNIAKNNKKKINKLSKLFSNLSILEYLILWNLLKYKDENGGDKIYLSTISQELNIPISKVSQLIKRLEHKGLVIWEFNEDGTYISFPQATVDSAVAQEKVLREFLKKVAEDYGEEDFKKLIDSIVKFSKIVDKELDDYRGMDIDG
jgi:DNA-binding MarR family transcriptional regulator